MHARERDNGAAASLDWWGALSRSCECWWIRTAGRQAVEARAAARTAELIAFARKHSPFYKEAWRDLPAGTAALSTLPIVTKRALMARFDGWVTDRRVDRAGVEAFIADRSHIGDRYLGRYVVWKSSGSTGEPGLYVQDDGALAVYDAMLAVQLQAPHLAARYGLGFVEHGGRAALVAATGDHFASIASWQRVCRGSPWPNARAFSVMDPLPELVAALNDYQPAFLASYPTTLGLLAGEQRDGRLRIAPAIIWSGGECLVPTAAKAIERAFGGVLVNEYGASECMSIAFSCTAGWLHVNADWVVLEPVDRDGQPACAGEPSHSVLLTNLANRVQPIIRYDLGDSIIANPEPCVCGSSLPAIRAEGRRDDVLALRARDGSIVSLSPLALTTVVEDATAGHRFQLVQTAPDRIAVRLDVADPSERTAEWDAAYRALHAYFAHQALGNVELALDAQPPIPDPRSGKLREVIAASGAPR
ncbi:MAG TPA: phenylacetate--CoA ligase family protein [Casimicrobiaceae bacterium]|nr:phenylacetate--CoA ligase family protein [Casimicrobiaceae bacterium]